MDQNNSIIPYQQNGLIPRVANSLQITNKILAKPEERLIPYRKKDKWGFCYSDKSHAIPCIYEFVKWFHEGMSAVKQNGKWGFINTKGETVIAFDFEEVLSFSNETAIVKFNGNAYKLNKIGELRILEPDEGYKWVVSSEDEKYFQKKREGTLTISSLTISDMSKISFSTELLILEICDEDYSKFNIREEKCGMIPFLENGKFGYSSVDKSTIIPAIYEDGFDFDEGFAFVNYKGNWGYIDKAGFQYCTD